MKTSACSFNRAIVRTPGRSVVNGLRAGSGEDPTYERVAAEHAVYVKALEAAGVQVTVLDRLEEFPDSVFVEDPALVFPEAAILLNSGASARVGEASAIRGALEPLFDQVLSLSEAGRVDGGDVLTTQNEVLIGLSVRTDEAGAKALARHLETIGRKARVVETPAGVLHFKSDCGLLDEGAVLATERLAASGVFDGFDIVTTPAGEEAAANCLRVNDIILLGARFPKTAEMLDKMGYVVVPLSTAEIAKLDAGLSCMSLRWRTA